MDSTTDFSRIRQVQRRVRHQKLHSLRITNISKNIAPLRKINEDYLHFAANAKEFINNFSKHDNVVLQAVRMGQLQSRVFIKSQLEATKNEYHTEKLVLESESNFYRSILF